VASKSIFFASLDLVAQNLIKITSEGIQTVDNKTFILSGGESEFAEKLLAWFKSAEFHNTEKNNIEIKVAGRTNFFV
jgi:heme-degrading monooxygenase HmoA